MEREQISYDMVDPLQHEKPFFVREKTVKTFEKKKFPFFKLAVYAVVIPAMIFLIGLLYIGGIWNPVKRVTDLDYLIINDDIGCNLDICKQFGLTEKKVGDAYAQIKESGAGKFVYEVNKGEDYARQQIEDYNYWAVIYVPKDFTNNVFTNLNVTEIEGKAVNVKIIYDESRSYTTVTYVKKAFGLIEKAFFNSFISGEKSLTNQLNAGFQQLAQVTHSDPVTVDFKTPFYINGIQYTEENLRPVNGFGQNFSTFISLIIIWIGTIATSIISHFFYPFEKHWIEKKNATHAIAKTMILKGFVCAALMFIITVVIPLFCGDVQNQKGFAALLFFSFFFSFAGLGINNFLIHLLPFIFYYLVVVCLMIFQLVSCGGLVDLGIEPNFWNLGKALPMYYGVREIKYIYWGTGDQFQLTNILVLAAWAAVSIIASYFLYFLELKTKRRRWLKMNEVVETEEYVHQEQPSEEKLI